MVRRFDWLLFGSVFLLLMIGLIVLHSITFHEVAPAQHFNPTIQVVAALLGLATLVFISRMDYRLLTRIAPVWYAVSIGLLIIVLIFGDTIFGATRSLQLGFFEFQPTEIAKLGLILILARFYSLHNYELHRISYLLVSIGLLAAVIALVILQPDLGSVLVLFAIWFLMTIMSATRRVYIFGIIVLSLAMMPVAMQFMEPYQQARISTFMEPAADPQGQGYNVNQALIAVGSGEVFGRGLSGGTQSGLNFIPSQHTDFIFAVLAEKLGLFGAGVVMLLFGVVIWRGLLIAWRAKDRFGALLATGITSMLLVQVIITVGMNLGVAPVTGLPLPFIAYGGTNLIISLFAVGVLQSIAAHSSELQFGE